MSPVMTLMPMHPGLFVFFTQMNNTVTAQDIVTSVASTALNFFANPLKIGTV
jgi:hypothetical protein